MKKKLVLTMMMSALLFSRAAADFPVIDIVHILETIHVGLQTYQQVQNTIKQLEYQYRQTQMQLQNLQAMDFGDIDGVTDAIGYIDRNLSFLRNTENRLKNIRIQAGKNSYNLASMYRTPGGMFDEMADLWTRELSDYEKAKIYSRYGLDPRNYLYVQTWKHRVQDGAKRIAALADDAEKQFEENGKEVEAIAEKSRNADSTVALLQANNELQRKIHEELQMLSYTTKITANMLADKAMAEEYNRPETRVSDDFFTKSTMPDLEFNKGERE